MPIYSNRDRRYGDPFLEEEIEDTGFVNEFSKGVGAGVDQLQGLIGGGGKALVGSIFGSDDMFYEGMQYYQEQMEEAAENEAAVGRIEDIDGLGDFALYASYMIGNFVPSLAGGGVAGAAGKGIAKKALNKQINKKAQSIADKEVKDVAERELQKKLARDYAQTASARAGNVGLATGAVGFGTAAGAGESFTRVWEETGEERAGLALATGLTSGALDALTPMRVLKKMMPDNAFKKARESIGDGILSDKRRITRALKEGIKTGGVEGATEMMQEIVQSYAVEFVKAEDDPTLQGEFLERMFDEDKQSMYANAFVAGLVGGKGIGLVQGGLSSAPKVAPKSEDADPEATEDPDAPVDTETPAQEETLEQKLARERREKQLKAVGIPTEDRPEGETPEQARVRTQQGLGIPTRSPQGELDVGDASDPELSRRRQKEARLKVRSQLDGMPRARAEARRILQINMREMEDDVVNPPAPEPTLPENVTPPLEQMVGKDVDYQGVKGILQKSDDGYVVVSEQGDILVESGEFQSPEELGIRPTDGAVEFERDIEINPKTKKFDLRGKTFTLTRIVRDADGNPLSLAVRDDQGKKKTIRTKEIVDRIDGQLTPKPNFNNIMVEFDELPVAIQKEMVTSMDAETIPDQISGQQALEVAQTLPDAEALTEQVNEAVENTFTARQGQEIFESESKYSESVRRGGIYSLAEAIKEVNAGMGANRTPIDEQKVRNLLDGEDKVLQDGSSIKAISKSDKDGIADEVANALVDLYEAGLPKSIMNSVNGIYVHTNANGPLNNTDGSFATGEKYISLNEKLLQDIVRDANDDTDKASRMRFTLAHEIGHAYDIVNDHTFLAPEWSIELDGTSAGSVTFELGSLMGELARNYQQKTELGKELSYPFGLSFDWVTGANISDTQRAVGTVQKEAFAQAFAVFHANPELLQEQAPQTYNYLNNLLRTTERSNESDNQARADEPQLREVQGEVRTPTEPRSDEVQDEAGTGRLGGDRPVAEQASEVVGGETIREDGRDTGRPVQLTEEDQFESDLIEQELGDPDILLDDDEFLFAPFTRVPEPEEQAPILPMGKVEQSLSDLLAETNDNPTPEQLATITGSPKKRKGKEDVQDVDVRPVTLRELRQYVRESLDASDNLKWYDEFGGFLRELVGDANLDEAAVIFGVTSAQNAAENNLAETLHIMSLARKFNPVTDRKQFELAVQNTPRKGGQRLMVTADQIKRIADMYENGDFAGGIKTTTYMQMVADRGRNEYNPFSVQDVHMSRVFGFRKKDYDKKSGELVDAAKISSENEYRYAQYLTSVLAEEFNMTPNQMQATLWFYAKSNLSPIKDSGGRAGTIESATEYSKNEIDVINQMIADGTFDKDNALTEPLTGGLRPRNKPVQKTTPFSNVNERDQLLEVARARAPKIIASAVAGQERGLSFPEGTPIETLVQYNKDVMDAITDDAGQIPILREEGIPHEVVEAAGSFTGYEPAMTIRLLGADMETANKYAPLLGDALLQDAVITQKYVYQQNGMPTFTVMKADEGEFTREEGMALAARLNPNNDPQGINFNQPLANTLVFLDSRSLDDSVSYNESMIEEFFGTLESALGDGYSITIGASQGEYYGSDGYRQAIEAAWNKEDSEGSPSIYDRTADNLYEPVRQVYNRYAKELGIPEKEELGDFLNAPPTNVTDLNARREKKNLEEFRTKFMGEVRSRVEQNRALTEASKADGFFGNFDKGIRYITSYDRDGETVQFKNEVVGISMSKVGRFDREGGKFNPLGPIPQDQIIEGADGNQYYANLVVKAVNPDGEEYQTAAAVYKLEKLAADGKLQIMGGLRAVPDILESPTRQKVGAPNTKGIPKVTEAYNQFKAGEISRDDYDTIANGTVTPYTFVPEPATQREMFDALDARKREKINVEIPDGENVGLRLDIPAYTNNGVWVPTIHGKATSHRATASITNADFTKTPQSKAEKVMEGGSKSPFAQIRGAFVNRTDEENAQIAEQALLDKNWTQVGFDPRRHSFFYDRETGAPILEATEVVQVGPLVLAKNAVKGKSEDFLFSPTETVSDTAELNRAIREEETATEKVKSGASSWFRRNLTAKGWLPDTVFDEKIKRDGELGAVELDIRQMLGVVDKAIKSHYAELSEDQLAFLNDALGDKFIEIDTLDIPSDIKEGIVAMRTYLDNLSKRYAVQLIEDAQRLQEAGDPDALAKADLIQTIAGNVGRYLNRSYRAFDDPNWYKKVPDDVLDNARDFLIRNGSQNPERTLNEILKNNTAYDSMEAFISESKLGAKDLSILKKRKEIAPEILALLGEYKDPRINFVKSATKMSRLLFNHDFLNRVKAVGEGVFLFTKDTAPSEAYVPFASEGSKAMEPLNGYLAEPEVVQAFKDALENEQLPDWYRQWVRFNGVVKYGKTVIAPTTAARNFMSAAFFTVANGHFNLSKINKSREVFKTYFTANKGSELDYLKRIKRLGVVYDTPYAGEMMDLLKDTNFGTDLNLEDGFKGKLGKFLNTATRAYQFGDDFWKIVGFENEVNIIMEAKNISREDAEPLAAQRIRDTYPTYSLVGRKVKALRRFPLLGTFVSFPAEIIRTQFNMLRYMKQDMADPDMSATVPRRALGFAMVSGGAYALQNALLNSHDVSEDEEEALRLLSPHWSRNSNIAITGRDDDGNLNYMDLTHLDPYAYFKKPINAILRDQPIEDAIVQAGQELLTPFFGYDITTATVLQVWQNETATGGKVFNPEDTPENIAGDIGAHLVKGLAPSITQNINRTMKAVNNEVSASGRRYNLDDEMAALAGFRMSTFDPKASLYFKTFEFSDAKRSATSLLTKTFRDPNEVSDSELKNAFSRSSLARQRAFTDMSRVVTAARRSGLSDTKIMVVLRSNGVTIKDAKALIKGEASDWEMSDSTLKNSIKKSDLLFGEATGKEFERRWSLIQQYLKEEI